MAKNRALPDTQDAFSENLTDDDSQSLYPDARTAPPIWAKLISRNQKLSSVDLRFNQTSFGRDVPGDENMDAVVFTQENCKTKFFDGISKIHWIIEREDNGSAHEYRPAVLTCKGRNGVFIKNDKLCVDDKRILAHGDIIKFNSKYELYVFEYQNIPHAIESYPKECLARYFIAEQIGSGGCGIVRKIYNLNTCGRFAMKVIKKETNPMVRTRIANNQKILNEVEIMKSLSHVHVLNLMDFFETPEKVIIIMDFMEGRDLLHRITQYQTNRKYLLELDAKFFFLQICRGLKYLHENFVTHRDIKPDNILMSSDSPDAIVKISDFGLSKLILGNSMKTVCGTQLYVAPEVLFATNYTNKVDVWSMGCLLFAMLSGSVPFCEPDVQAQIKEARFSFRQRVWNEVSRPARELIRRMLQKNPEMRPAIAQVIEHPWLQCKATIARIQKLYNLDDTILNESDQTELEQTLINVSLNETPVPPPMKRRRIDN